jgi:DNA-directed RNA polymerase I and III subunit RPAC2
MNNKEVEVIEQEKLKIIPDNDEGNFNCTYSFTGEDHTLGNLLRYVLMKDTETLFCGYSVPHPSEDIMNVRLQTHTNKTDIVLNNAFDNIIKINNILKNKFKSANDNFNKNK